MRVTYFQRKPRSGKNFSLEQVFENVRKQLAEKIDAKVWIAPFESRGLFRRLLIGISAFWSRDEINHVTGDINFLSIFLPKRKTVLTILDLGVLDRLTGFKRFIVRLFWFQLPVWRCARVTVISEATRKSLLEAVHCEPEKVIVVPVAISEKFKLTPKAFDSSCPTILQVGTNPNKNLTRVIKALDGIDCQLWIVGKLSASDQELLQTQKVKYRNWVGLTDDEVIERYQNCDLVLFASTFEGFGMPILEANAIGRPVITSNVTSMPEVAGTAALLVDPYSVSDIAHAVRRVIDDPQLRENLVEDGYKNVLRFGSSEIASQYLDIYKRILKSDNA